MTRSACPRCEAVVDELGPTGRLCPECLLGFGLEEAAAGLPLEPGTILGRYRLMEAIGFGGMGVVYRARDERLGRDVAVKVMAPGTLEEEGARRRFHREARALSRLNHPNVGTVHDFDHDLEVDFLVMELVEGETLSDRLQGEPLPDAEVISLGAQLAEGLAAAHEKGVIHRDLKPGNLRVTPDGLLKLLDFGLAKEVGGTSMAPAVTGITEDGVMPGTPAYMAPEQLAGLRADERTDIYAAGLVLYEMSTGRLPFEVRRSMGHAADPLHRPPPPPREVNPALSPRLERVLLRCLEREPDRRPGSAAELAAELRQLGRPGAEPVPARAERVPSPPSIAVLSPEDLSAGGDQEYFCDGMAEELLNSLAQIEGLRVASRTSAFQFKGKSLDVRSIGRQLNVETVLEGSVRRQGDRLRILMQLIAVEDGFHLWSESFDRDAGDVFTIQEQIARAVVSELKGKLLPRAAEVLVDRRPTDLEAYDLYLRGRYHWARRYEGGMQQAVEAFQAAIARDPSYALAHAGLADTYSVLGMYSLRPPREAFAAAREEVEAGLRLAPDLPELHFSTGVIRFWHDWAFPEAEVSFHRALELRPAYAEAFAWLAQLHGVQGRFDRGLDAMRRARDLDPLSPILCSIAGFLRYLAREYDAALRECETALDMDARSVVALWVQGMTLVRLGRFEPALESLERGASLMANAPFYRSLLGVAHAEAGREDRARAILAELEGIEPPDYVAPFHRAAIHIALGENDLAFRWLERAREDRNGNLCALATSPDFDRLRSDPRFDELRRRAGL